MWLSKGVCRLRRPYEHLWVPVVGPACHRSVPWESNKHTSTIPESPATWDFPKIRGALFWGPYSKDPTI